MRIRVRIRDTEAQHDDTFVIPISNKEKVARLAAEASSRYAKKHAALRHGGILIELRTERGEVLDDDDIVSQVLHENEMLLANVVYSPTPVLHVRKDDERRALWCVDVVTSMLNFMQRSC